MKLLIQDRIVTEAKNISELRKVNLQNLIHFALSWYKSKSGTTAFTNWPGLNKETLFDLFHLWVEAPVIS